MKKRWRLPISLLLSVSLMLPMMASFGAMPTQAVSLTRYDNNDPLIQYVGWSEYGATDAYGASVHSAPNPGSLMQACFSDCTTIELYGGRGPDRGFLNVYIDGVLMDSIDTYAAAVERDQVLLRISDLPRGEHTLQIIVANQKNEASSANWMEVDGVASDGILIDRAIEVIDPETGNQIIDDVLPEYSGSWTNYTLLDESRGFYSNTATSTTEDGAAVSYTFAYCTGIRWYSTTGAAYGSAEVSIDGRVVSTVNVGAMAAANPVAVFDSGELTPGEHTITIQKTGNDGLYIEIDRLIGVGENKAGYSWIRAANQNFFMVNGPKTISPNGDMTLSGAGREVFLSFCGSSLTLIGQKTSGTAEVWLDGESKGVIDLSKNEIIAESDNLSGTLHSVKLVVQEGTLCLRGAKLDTPDSVAKNLSDLARAELETIQKGEKPVLDESEWNPVDRKATVPLTGVRLDNGVFLDAFNKNIRYLKRCSTNVLYVDQETIWTDELRASTEGRMMAGIGNTLRFTEDAELAGILDKILGDITARTDASGWCMPYPTTNYAPHPGSMIDENRNYDRVMFTRGLVAAGKAGRNDAFQLLRNFYDWLNACEYLPYMLDGGLGTQGSLGTILAYESPVGKAEDLYTNMKYYDMDWWLESLAAGVPEAIYRYPLNRPHSYLLVSMESFLAEYVATGEQKYLDAVMGAWNIFYNDYKNVGGGICICEGPTYLPGNYTLDPKHGVYENCGNVFWTELNSRLLELDPTNETYASEIEQCLYNMLFASQGEDGTIRYFQLYNGTKTGPSAINTCCENMATGQLGSLPQYIYSVSDEGLYINLFAASAIESATASVTMETEFPYANDVSLTVDKAADTTLYIRVPNWNEGGMDIYLNGNKVGTGEAGSYYALKQNFRAGDRVTFTLSPGVTFHKYIGDTQVEGHDRYAVTYGPILLAAEGTLNFQHKMESGDTARTIRLDITAKELAETLTMSDGLVFTSDRIGDVKFVPYMNIQTETFAVFPVLNQGEGPENNPGTPPDTTPDTTPDTEPDTTPDTEPETDSDTAVDTAPESEPESGPSPETNEPSAGLDTAPVPVESDPSSSSKKDGCGSFLPWGSAWAVAAITAACWIFRRKRATA